MFSIIPRIGTDAFRQKLISLRTSPTDKPWGVVTRIAPSGFRPDLSVSTTEMCSSDVPGGVSISRKSSSPQSTSSINCLIIAFFFGLSKWLLRPSLGGKFRWKINQSIALTFQKKPDGHDTQIRVGRKYRNPARVTLRHYWVFKSQHERQWWAT